MPGRHGVQPALGRLVMNEISIARAAQAAGITPQHLSQVLHGSYRATPEVRASLADLLGEPEGDLFLDAMSAVAP